MTNLFEELYQRQPFTLRAYAYAFGIGVAFGVILFYGLLKAWGLD